MDSTLYGVPKAVETLVLIYNKDLIAKPLNSLQDWYDFSKQQRAQNQYGLLAKFDQIYYSWGLSPRWAGTSSVKTIKAVITPATWA